MPTQSEREYYAMGFRDGAKAQSYFEEQREPPLMKSVPGFRKDKPKRKLSAWNKFVKANSRKKEFRYANGKLKLKKMGSAFRRKKRR